MKREVKKQLSWIIFAGILIVGALLAYNFYLVTNLNDDDNGRENRTEPFYTSVEIGYEEKKLPADGETLEVRNYLVTYDENGHFVSEVVSGPNAGARAEWDGTMYREFNPEGDETNSQETSSGAVAPHPFLSRATNEQIRKWLDDGTLGTGEGDVNIIGRTAQAFVKTESAEAVPAEWVEKYPSIFDEGENEEAVTYYVDVNERILLAAESRNNGNLFHSIRMTSFEAL
ncbi:hypothetical protein EVJ27_05810 [Exiguobacterium sp. SH3S2]|uniref:hypothetical protein n=1 Tax=unclassified Exiguobacterium TaxID=2644629 RepID=UPI00103BC73B|nr:MULTISPECIES: hypothetical protein [unclassified Exiguobacterium]TCI24697.1 hypothetical protein EVJ32_13025 [Exiguobacterium sp. SH5S4]TCI46415.1 hypothetical protein EVJ28_05805 [Exiguobacterium sp. SH3S3]TCI57144.1 hypothetical protein EVJ30_02520 [Exiguobacterium sp. SH5S13]TCI62057.1 hypothetical protein EVJ27_05810 [Exiguobacterium sp. SH3S2]TCI62682.1 hypothetical protein EVJ26_07170 [Exiguobacterium sp. SH3S1]